MGANVAGRMTGQTVSRYRVLGQLGGSCEGVVPRQQPPLPPMTRERSRCSPQLVVAPTDSSHCDAHL
jgi:hypothetical protein